MIGDRLRMLRVDKNLTQGDIERRTGLLRCYVSRVENGYTVPAVETLEKLARALEVPLYQLFYDLDPQPKLPNRLKRYEGRKTGWGDSGKDARTLERFRRMLGQAKEEDRKLLLFVARKMAKRKAI